MIKLPIFLFMRVFGISSETTQRAPSDRSKDFPAWHEAPLRRIPRGDRRSDDGGESQYVACIHRRSDDGGESQYVACIQHMRERSRSIIRARVRMKVSM